MAKYCWEDVGDRSEEVLESKKVSTMGDGQEPEIELFVKVRKISIIRVCRSKVMKLNSCQCNSIVVLE